MDKTKQPPPLEPPDLKQCQCGIITYNPMRLGGKVLTEVRCTNKPVNLAKERQPDEHGRRGAMSLCQECTIKFIDKMYMDKYEITPLGETPLDTLLRELYRWNAAIQMRAHMSPSREQRDNPDTYPNSRPMYLRAVQQVRDCERYVLKALAIYQTSLLPETKEWTDAWSRQEQALLDKGTKSGTVAGTFMAGIPGEHLGKRIRK